MTGAMTAALSIGLLAYGATSRNGLIEFACGLLGTLALGASLVCPIGYFVNRRTGALIGAAFGMVMAFSVYVVLAMIVYANYRNVSSISATVPTAHDWEAAQN